jgi:hypothetical protein
MIGKPLSKPPGLPTQSSTELKRRLQMESPARALPTVALSESLSMAFSDDASGGVPIKRLRRLLLLC